MAVTKSKSSSVEYNYNSGGSLNKTRLRPVARHNLNGEIGLDIVLPDSYSIFVVYERSQACQHWIVIVTNKLLTAFS